MDLSSLVKEAQNVQASGFIELVEKATDLLRGESGHIGNFTVNNRLVELEPRGEALVVGDLHGDLQSLTAILQTSGFIEKMEQNTEASLVFLGDYGDRGPNSAEVYYVVLSLKLAFAGQVVLLRGNHEGTKNLMAYPHDLPVQFQERFGTDWSSVYQKTASLFPYLYNAVHVKERYLMVHGGISPAISGVQDIAQAQEGHNEALLEDLLWSDPTEDGGIYPNPRGAGRLFGQAVTEEILGKVNAKVLIRGHEACKEGFKINHGGKVLTLFSRKGAPYHNRHGAYLLLPLSEKFTDATELVAACVRQF